MKYKSLIYLRDVVHKKGRLLNFKRPKWKIIQSIFRTRYLKKLKFKRNRRKGSFFSLKTALASFRWTRLFQLYKSFLQTKVKFQWFYGRNMSLRQLKKMYLRFSEAYLFAVMYEYRAENIIWRSGFFTDVALTRQAVMHKKVYLNGKLLTHPNLTLKKGDVIRLALSTIQNWPKKGKLERLPPAFVESNYSTGEIFVVSEPDAALLKQVSYLYNSFLDLSALKHYLQRL